VIEASVTHPEALSRRCLIRLLPPPSPSSLPTTEG